MMKPFMLEVAIGVLVLVLASACAPGRSPSAEAPTKLTQPMAERLTLEYRACTIDTDCVLALNGCCDCANGGEDIAVSRDMAAAFGARFHCSGACTEMGGDCGHGTVQCENQLCTYREPAAH